MASPESYNDPYDCWLSFPGDTLLSLLEAALVNPFIAATKMQELISPREIESAKKSPRPLEDILRKMELVNSLCHVLLAKKGRILFFGATPGGSERSLTARRN